jgi:hypothetical protein
MDGSVWWSEYVSIVRELRSEEYSILCGLYRELYPATRSIAHDLARRQRA